MEWSKGTIMETSKAAEGVWYFPLIFHRSVAECAASLINIDQDVALLSL